MHVRVVRHLVVVVVHVVVAISFVVTLQAVVARCILFHLPLLKVSHSAWVTIVPDVITNTLVTHVTHLLLLVTPVPEVGLLTTMINSGADTSARNE